MTTQQPAEGSKVLMLDDSGRKITLHSTSIVTIGVFILKILLDRHASRRCTHVWTVVDLVFRSRDVKSGL